MTITPITFAPETEEIAPETIIALREWLKDVRKAATLLSDQEARYLVDQYYTIQDYRKAMANQVRAVSESEEPNEFLRWVFALMKFIEGEIQRELGRYTDQSELGRWCKSITGIGPVIAAGLMAHIDITRCEKATSLWRFAGLDPTSKWLGNAGARAVVQDAFDTEWNDDGEDLVTPEQIELVVEGRNALTYLDIVRVAALVHRHPEQLARAAQDERGRVTRDALIKVLARRPWNAELKTLCWKIGESFNKNKNRENDHYGWHIDRRKHYEWEKNIRGDYAGQAREVLASKNIGRGTEAYAWYSGQYRLQPDDVVIALAGTNEIKGILDERRSERGVPMLPPGHIHARAKRYAVKIFLAHYHAVAYELHHGRPSPMPYALAHLEHVDEIPVVNWPLAA